MVVGGASIFHNEAIKVQGTWLSLFRPVGQ